MPIMKWLRPSTATQEKPAATRRPTPARSLAAVPLKTAPAPAEVIPLDARALVSAWSPGSSRVVRRERVPVQRLDRFIGDCLGGAPSPSLYLKLDTQGYDLEVLRGAEGCLHRIVALQSEVSVKPIYEGQPSLTEALARLGTLGFEVGGLYPVTRDHAGRVVEFDCVALRTG